VDSLIIGGIVFGCTFGGALGGILLRGLLPDPHLSPETKDVVKLGTGLIATMSALVLGLLIASAKSSYDAQRNGFQQMAINVIVLDRSLGRYGPEAKEARAALRNAVSATIDTLWPAGGSRTSHLDAPEITQAGTALYNAIQKLAPENDFQKLIQSQALQTGTDLGKTRWLIIQQQEGGIPVAFLVVLVFWLAVLFISFGLFSPRNGTAITALFICAVSVAGAIFLIVDLDQSFEGLIQVSSTPLRNALLQLGQ